ncbi:response regulator transcription factor [Oryzomicrobium sp.]|uniref:response regulator transcription factor n=1 Tax=Oryzomicrobium sp. TaxID=1911578 RepID=UPI002FE06F9D
MILNVMLVDDHAVVRTGYRRLIDAEPGFTVVAEAASADEACAALRDAPRVDVVVMDLSLRQGSGLEAIRRLLDRQPDLRILVFSMHHQSAYVTQALRNGAVGYLTKHSEPLEMVAAIRKVAQGQQAFSDDVAQLLARLALEGSGELARLTPREFEVLRLTAGGEAPGAVATRLHLSPKTVFNHLSAIRQKLEVDNDLALFRLAARYGLVELQPAAV